MDKSLLYNIPPRKFTYDPTSFCDFSNIGESLVKDLINKTPSFYQNFNRFIPVSEQKQILDDCFRIGKSNYFEERNLFLNSPILGEIEKIEENELQKNGKRDSKPFFEKNMKFRSFAAPWYKRTLAPRLTTEGGTFHGMKKEMVNQALIKSTERLDGTFIDLDLSACHANVASAVKNDSRSQLYQLVNIKGGNFWSDHALVYQKQLASKGVEVDLKQLRSILKVAFYTSLNGGNPFSEKRLASNLKDNAPDQLKRFSSIQEFSNSESCKTIREVISNFPIISEVTTLNTKCVNKKRKITYTVDRVVPYSISSAHKGISRVLIKMW